MNTIEKALSKKQALSGQTEKRSESENNNTEFHHLEADHSANVFDKVAEKVAENSNKESQNEPEDLFLKEKDIKERETKNSKSVSLDLKQLDSLGYLVPDHNNSILNEEYRQIKRPLMNNIKGKSAHAIKNANVIQVTSSLQSEGKSFTALNLALSFAIEMDLNVLLVDADTIKSSLTRILLNTDQLGLNDYLSGDVEELSEVLVSTNIPTLSLLPAGTRHRFSTELFNSDNMEKLIIEFAERYDNRIVIFDSPPLLQTNDARILSQKIGQLVFVVEENKTEQSTVKNALALLDPEMVIGVVMNKSRSVTSAGYYGYYGSSK